MTVDLDQLAALARVATGGEWTHIPSTSYRVGNRTRSVGPMVTAVADQRHGGGVMQFRSSPQTEDADAAYIAAASPDVVLSLIERVRALEQDTERYRDALEICAADEVPAGTSAIAINRRNIARHALCAADAAAAEKIGGAG